MAEIKKVQSVKVWGASDGKSFDNKADAARHQSILNLRAWFQATVDEASAVQLVDAITSDVDGFREIVHPILAKPRAPRGSKKAAESLTGPTAEPTTAEPTPISAGSKRKAA